MARMKFLCDTKRCIECNGCVTACKNANSEAVGWGIQRRRVVTLNDGLIVKLRFLLLVCTVVMRLVWRCVLPIVSVKQKMALFSTIKIYVSVVVTAYLLVRLVRLSSLNNRHLLSAVKWTNVLTVQVVQILNKALKKNAYFTVQTASLKASCQCVHLCVLLSRYLQVMQRRSLKSTANV